MVCKNLVIYIIIGAVVIGLFTVGLLIRGINPETENPDVEDIEEEVIIHGGEEVILYLFWGEGCPYCEKAKTFLTEIKESFPSLTIKDYEVYYNSENRDLFVEMAKSYGIDNPQGVPMIFINDQYFIGFAEDPIGLQIVDIINGCLTITCLDPATRLID